MIICLRIDKALFCSAFVLLVFQTVHAQYVYKIKADTVRIYNTCDTAELVRQNRTQNVLGYLYNKGAGVTEFRALGAIDSMYRRNDTLFYHTIDGKTFSVKIDLANFIKNQNAVAQSGTFSITGSGVAGAYSTRSNTTETGTISLFIQSAGSASRWNNRHLPRRSGQ